MQALKAAYTEVWVPSAVVPLVQFADRVRALSSTGIDLVGIPGRTPPPGLFEGFDRIVSWYGTQRPEFRSMVPNAEFRPALPPPDATVHAVEFFGGSGYPQIHVDTAEPRNFIAIHPFSGSAKKNWPLERFQELHLPYPAQYCISPEQPTLPGAVQYDNLYDLARWLRGAALYIGNDSGITHLAAACGVPTVAIFTEHSNPRIWAPRGPHVEVVSPGDSVPAAVDRLLARGGITHPQSVWPDDRT